MELGARESAAQREIARAANILIFLLKNEINAISMPIGWAFPP
jgi:hypothetical protein